MSQASVTAHRRAYGQFFTPEPVVACCYQLCAGALPLMPQIVDPACGDGAFLRYALAHAITDRDRVSGCDLDPALTNALTTAGLPRIRQADGLASASLLRSKPGNTQRELIFICSFCGHTARLCSVEGNPLANSFIIRLRRYEISCLYA